MNHFHWMNSCYRKGGWLFVFMMHFMKMSIQKWIVIKSMRQIGKIILKKDKKNSTQVVLIKQNDKSINHLLDK